MQQRIHLASFGFLFMPNELVILRLLAAVSTNVFYFIDSKFTAEEHLHIVGLPRLLILAFWITTEHS